MEEITLFMSICWPLSHPYTLYFRKRVVTQVASPNVAEPMWLPTYLARGIKPSVVHLTISTELKQLELNHQQRTELAESYEPPFQYRHGEQRPSICAYHAHQLEIHASSPIFVVLSWFQ